MRPKILFALFGLAALLACSCRASRTPTAMDVCISSLQQYGESLGLSIEAARDKLAGAKISEEKWASGGFGGPQLVGTFPKYEVRILFSEGKAITTAVQVIASQ
jgi:hypothetical protein